MIMHLIVDKINHLMMMQMVWLLSI